MSDTEEQVTVSLTRAQIDALAKIDPTVAPVRALVLARDFKREKCDGIDLSPTDYTDRVAHLNHRGGSTFVDIAQARMIVRVLGDAVARFDAATSEVGA